MGKLEHAEKWDNRTLFLSKNNQHRFFELHRQCHSVVCFCCWLIDNESLYFADTRRMVNFLENLALSPSYCPVHERTLFFRAAFEKIFDVLLIFYYLSDSLVQVQFQGHDDKTGKG